MASLIAIVDDENSVVRAVGRLVKSAGLDVEGFSSAEEFLEAHLDRSPNCLILDMRLPGMSGLELQNRLATSDHRLPIIFVSAHDDAESRARALEGGALAFLGKPFNDEALLQTIQSVLQSGQ